MSNEVRKWLNKPGNNFCVMPFIHMAIEANGDIRPCCMGDSFDLNITGKTIQQVYNDPLRLQFVDSFRRNEQHPLCHVCWKDPEVRIKFSSVPMFIETTKQAMTGILPEHKLRWLEIKPGNRCNLKCRICGVHNSSSWAKDDAALINPNLPFKKSDAYKYTQSCDWIDDPTFWNDIHELDEIKLIHFMGGEPYMVPEHFQLLERLVADPDVDTSKITIRYNTNGTYFPSSENLSLYNNFYQIIMGLSIDDIGERFNYQRKLADWEEVKSNLIKFKKLNSKSEGDKFPQFYAEIDPTISIFNIFYLNEITEEFNKLGFYEFTEARHFAIIGIHAIHVLPQYLKDVIIAKYKESDNPWVTRAVKYMNSQKSSSKMWKEFKETTSNLDARREENFQNIFKEFYEHF